MIVVQSVRPTGWCPVETESFVNGPVSAHATPMPTSVNQAIVEWDETLVIERSWTAWRYLHDRVENPKVYAR